MTEDPDANLDPRISAAYASLSPQQRAQLSVALARRAASAETISAVERAGRDEFATSSGQERIWFLDQLRPGSLAYVVPVALRLTGALDAVALQRALHAVVVRHEALRTTFPAPAGRPVQRIAPVAPVDLKLLDVGDLPASRRPAAIDAAHRREAATPFDLETGPLLRATLVRTGADEHVLLLSLHHIIADGWTVALIVGELARLYQGEELPPPPFQYVDFAAWQRDRLRGGVLAEQLAYWRKGLRGAMPLALPTDRPRGDTAAGGDAHAVTWDATFVDDLRALAVGANATLFMVVLAGIAATLSRWSQQHDVVIGTPVGGRDHAAWETVAGFFANTLPLRIDLAGGSSFRELIARARTVTLDGLAHQSVPYEKVVEALRPDRADTPLVQAMLALRNVPSAVPAMGEVAITVLDSPVIEAKFDLTWELADDGSGGLSGRLEYASGLFDAATAERLHESLTILLRAACGRPDDPVSRLPIMTPRARAELVDGVPDADGRRQYVLDERSEPVPIGAAGFLSISATGEPAATGRRARRDRAGRIELLPELAPVHRDVPTAVARPMIPPSDALERILAGVWTDVLEVEAVGVLDDFFELGGHSLLVTQAVSRIQAMFAMPVPLDGALTATSIRDFAGYLRDLGAHAGLDVDAVAERAERGIVDTATVAVGPRRLDRNAYRQPVRQP